MLQFIWCLIQPWYANCNVKMLPIFPTLIISRIGLHREAFKASWKEKKWQIWQIFDWKSIRKQIGWGSSQFLTQEMRNTELNGFEWKRENIQFRNCCPWGYTSKLPINELPRIVKPVTTACGVPNSLNKYAQFIWGSFRAFYSNYYT